MSEKEMVSLRLHKDTKRRVERYAEEHDVTRSTAMRRLLEKGADLEEAGLAVAAASTTSENQEVDTGEGVRTDGDGAVIRPILNAAVMVYSAMAVAFLSYLLAVMTFGLPLVVSLFDIVGIAISLLLLISPTVVLLYTEIPEQVDSAIHARLRGLDRLPIRETTYE